MRMEKSDGSAPPRPTSLDPQELISQWLLHWSGWERQKQGEGHGPGLVGAFLPSDHILGRPSLPSGQAGCWETSLMR